jgi:hypothetical protein
MANKYQSEQYAQDEHGWYREPRDCVDAMFRAISFDECLIWDPCCGMGNTLDAAKAIGLETIGSDIVDRHARHSFFRSNFLTATRYPVAPRIGLVLNPPYNAPSGTTENFIAKAFDLVPFERMAVLVPSNFLFGQTRRDELFVKHTPSHILFLSKRPSMPPGTEVDRLAATGDAFRGGKQDFAWLIFTAGGPYRTEARWLDWREPTPPSERRIRRGSQRPSASA